jgi:diphthine-ammonia ligase
MIEAGMEAILIKVAGIGLTEQHLGKTLTDMQPTLLKLVTTYQRCANGSAVLNSYKPQNDLYGSHVCGEGGEYETLTLDCPLFKHRIKL